MGEQRVRNASKPKPWGTRYYDTLRHKTQAERVEAVRELVRQGLPVVVGVAHAHRNLLAAAELIKAYAQAVKELPDAETPERRLVGFESSHSIHPEEARKFLVERRGISQEIADLAVRVSMFGEAAEANFFNQLRQHASSLGLQPIDLERRITSSYVPAADAVQRLDELVGHLRKAPGDSSAPQKAARERLLSGITGAKDVKELLSAAEGARTLDAATREKAKAFSLALRGALEESRLDRTGKYLNPYRENAMKRRAPSSINVVGATHAPVLAEHLDTPPIYVTEHITPEKLYAYRQGLLRTEKRIRAGRLKQKARARRRAGRGGRG